MTVSGEPAGDRILRSGDRLACAKCCASVVVICGGCATGNLACCGDPMTLGAYVRCSEPEQSSCGGSGTLRAGARYRDDLSGTEIRCTRSGDGYLEVDDRRMHRRTSTWTQTLPFRRVPTMTAVPKRAQAATSQSPRTPSWSPS
jgi:hypothetical protein